ncbi:MAG: histidine kinase [Proteobacteria bacterium]|nr:histidine kinase [Pseudomonadota bacterium]
MMSTFPAGDSTVASRQGRYFLRALRSVGYGVVAGLCIALIRQQPVWTTVLYSMCIALACWFFIDSGRLLVSARVTDGRQRPGWPGWGWMTGIVLIGGCLGLLSGTLLGDMLTGEHTPILSGNEDVRHMLADLLLVLLPALIITYFFNARSTIADREAAVQAAQRQAAESRLRLLEAQLEPHMFFNTLANLHVLIGLDPPRAQAMLDQLITFLRATLNGSRATEHPLRAELARTRDYLSLMQVRMEDRLRVHFDLPDTLAEVPVPPLLLQPLVENAIKHGLEPSVRGGRIEVTAAREGDILTLKVRDTGVGLGHRVAKGTSFGLQQVRERLATLYGERASLSLTAASDADGGTLAVIRMPMN